MKQVLLYASGGDHGSSGHGLQACKPKCTNALAEHWLSLWPGNALRLRGNFDAAAVKEFAANLMAMGVVADRSVTVRFAGSTFASVLGIDRAGRVWSALAANGHQLERSGSFSDIAAALTLEIIRYFRPAARSALAG